MKNLLVLSMLGYATVQGMNKDQEIIKTYKMPSGRCYQVSTQLPYILSGDYYPLTNWTSKDNAHVYEWHVQDIVTGTSHSFANICYEKGSDKSWAETSVDPKNSYIVPSNNVAHFAALSPSGDYVLRTDDRNMYIHFIKYVGREIPLQDYYTPGDGLAQMTMRVAMCGKYIIQELYKQQHDEYQLRIWKQNGRKVGVIPNVRLIGKDQLIEGSLMHGQDQIVGQSHTKNSASSNSDKSYMVINCENALLEEEWKIPSVNAVDMMAIHEINKLVAFGGNWGCDIYSFGKNSVTTENGDRLLQKVATFNCPHLFKFCFDPKGTCIIARTAQAIVAFDLNTKEATPLINDDIYNHIYDVWSVRYPPLCFVRCRDSIKSFDPLALLASIKERDDHAKKPNTLKPMASSSVEWEHMGF